MSYPPGVVGVIAQDTARFSMFAASLTGLAVPDGTDIVWRFGHSMSNQTNQLVEAMLAKPDKQWLWILGDDHSFSGNLLAKLLDHQFPDDGGPGPEIIVPLCLTRMPPYRPVIFSGFGDDGQHRLPVDLNEHPDGGVIAIHSAGSAGMLIKRTVLEEMEPPWFESYQISTVEATEDAWFCDKARDAGFQIYCDLDANLGHSITGVVWPVREPEGWTYGFSMMGGFVLRIPPQ